MRTLTKLIPFAVLVALVGGAWTLYANYPSPKTYAFTVLVSAPEQGGLAPVMQLLVTNVSRRADGSLCFDSVEGKSGCIKSAHYVLVEQRVQ